MISSTDPKMMFIQPPSNSFVSTVVRVVRQGDPDETKGPFGDAQEAQGLSVGEEEGSRSDLGRKDQEYQARSTGTRFLSFQNRRSVESNGGSSSGMRKA